MNTMNPKPNITSVTFNSVDQTGFFCYMSKRKTEGYSHKLAWVKARLNEGLRIKMILPPEGRGFIEYIPGEFAWRAVNAPGYMVIHCLWIVGKTRGQGHASLLLEECIKDAKQAGMHGVAMITTTGTWLLKKGYLEKHGFHSVAKAPPAFDLMVLSFDDAPKPTFTGNWDEKLKACGKGLTILFSKQCPYIANEVNYFRHAANEIGIPVKVVELATAEEVQRLSPSPYGVFNVVFNEKFITYHFLDHEDLREILNNS